MNYIEHQRSPRRRAAIVAGVIAFHLLLLAALTGWWGQSPGPLRSYLIRVDIVADTKSPARHAARPAAAPSGATATRPLP